MSTPNPPRHYRRWSDERIWRAFMASILATTLDASEAATLADAAYAEYRERFPVREPELPNDDDGESESTEAIRPS